MYNQRGFVWINGLGRTHGTPRKGEVDFMGRMGKSRIGKMSQLEGMKKELRKGKLNEKARIKENLRGGMET